MERKQMLFKKNYPELDLLRAIAIVLVMLFHLESTTFNLPQSSYFNQFLYRGYHGVDLFFVLSGFLIGGQLIESLRAGSFSFKEFYIKRFFRIAPAYYMAIMVSILYYSVWIDMFILRDDIFLKDFLVHIFYLQDYIPVLIQSGLYWSLAVEEQFYILIPGLIFLFYGRRQGRLFGFLLFFILAGFAMKFLIYDLLYDPSREWSLDFYRPLHMRFDSLLLGVLSALAFITYRNKLRQNAVAYKIALYSVTAVCLGLSFFYGSFGHGYFNSVWQFTLSGIGFSTLILAAATFSKPEMPLQRFFKPIARFSYAMYLYHMMVKVIFLNFLVQYFTVDNTRVTNFLMVFAVYFIIVFSLCGVHYLLIENPFLKYRKRLLSRMPD